MIELLKMLVACGLFWNTWFQGICNGLQGMEIGVELWLVVLLRF